MKRLIALAFLACSMAQAADPKNYPVSLNFARVELAELSHLVYGEILKQDFVIAPDVIANVKPVSIRMTTDRNTLAVTYAAFLESQGISVTLRKNTVWLSAKPEEGEQTQVFTYRPKHRKVEFLQDMLRPFIQGKIVAQRLIRKAENEVSPVNPPKGSAADMIDRDYDLLLVEATKADLKRISALLPHIDTPVGEVMLKAQVYEVSSSDKTGNAFGLALNLLDGKFGVSIGNTETTGDAIRIKTGSVNAVLSALSGDSRFKVVASPTVRIRDGQNARMTVGESVPVLGQVLQDKNGTPVQSVEYKESGVILDVTPKIRDNEIDLQVKQQLSNFVPTTTGVNNSPTLIKRELQTAVTIRPDELIMLGGLNQTKETGSRAGLSFLPQSWHTKNDDTSRTELLLVIHAQKI